MNHIIVVFLLKEFAIVGMNVLICIFIFFENVCNLDIKLKKKKNQQIKI